MLTATVKNRKNHLKFDTANHHMAVGKSYP